MLPQRPSGDDRYPPPAPRSSYHLPPPHPSATSPQKLYAPSQLPVASAHNGPGGLSDWVSGDWVKERDRQTSNSRARWSPPRPFLDRPGSSSSSRLPLPSSNYPHRGSGSTWDVPSPSKYPSWNTHNPNTRNTGPYPTAAPPAKHDERHSPPPQPIPPLAPVRPTISSRTSEASAHTPKDQRSRSNKHNDNEEGSPQNGQKKKRRVALSCAECAKRKQKCNRETPCQHCIARRVPELCVTYSRAGSPPRLPKQIELARDVKDEVTATSPTGTTAAPNRTPSMLPTLSVRVARIEALLNAVVNRVDGLDGQALSLWRINHAPATSPPPIRSLKHPRSRSNSDGGRPETGSSLSHPHMGNEERFSADPEGSRDGDEVVGLDLSSSIRNPIPQSMVRATTKGVPLSLDYHGTPAEQLQKLFQDCGVSPDKVADLMRELPQEDHADRLISWFFEKFNYVRYPIAKQNFYRSFKDLYASPTVNSRSVLFLPLIFIVFAIATRIAPDDWEMLEDEKRTQSLKMYWNSKSAIIIAQAVKAESVQLVETRLLTGLYLVLLHERRLAEGWAEFRAAITVGLTLGLHRDGTKLRLDHYTTEYRRMLWSYLLHADATYSCLLGRPVSIDPKCCDTLPPSNLDLKDLLNGKEPSVRPKSEPTFGTYLILRRALGEIVARMTQHFQRLEGPAQYKDVESLDAEFKTLIADLPPAFKITNPDKANDAKCWYLPVHRYYIQTEILHFRIILHRPWLLRKLRSSRYALSRAVCFETASKDFKIRQDFKRDVPDFFETLRASSFREFNGAMIAGISIIVDPHSPHSSDMKAILKSFMERHPYDPTADDFSQKESAIIYTLYQRAKELEEKRFAESIARPRSSSIRISQDMVSSERTEIVPQPRKVSSNSSLPPLQTYQSGPATNMSPMVGYWQRNSPLGQTSGTGTSPDEDQPQQLLDHWLMSNTAFGPELTSLDPSQPLLMNPADVTLGDAYLPTPNTNGMYMEPNYSMNNPQLDPAGSSMPMMPNMTMGNDLAYGVLDDKSMIGGVLGQQQLGPGGWGDGNSSQYWNNLVDRIALGVGSNYDSMGNS